MTVVSPLLHTPSSSSTSFDGISSTVKDESKGSNVPEASDKDVKPTSLLEEEPKLLKTISEAVAQLEAAGHTPTAISELVPQMLPEVGEPLTPDFLNNLLSSSELEPLISATQLLLTANDAASKKEALSVALDDPKVLAIFNTVVTLYAQFGDLSFTMDDMSVTIDSVLANTVLKAVSSIKYGHTTSSTSFIGASFQTMSKDTIPVAREVGEKLGLLSFRSPSPLPEPIVTTATSVTPVTSVALLRGLNTNKLSAPTTSQPDEAIKLLGSSSSSAGNESSEVNANAVIAEAASTSEKQAQSASSSQSISLSNTSVSLKPADTTSSSDMLNDIVVKSNYRLLSTSAPPIILMNTEGCLVLYFREGPPPAILHEALNKAIALALALRLILIDSDSVIRPLGWRACRKLVGTPASASLLIALSIDVLASRAVEKEHQFLWERMQAMRLIRRLLSTAPFAITHALGASIVSLGESTRDPFSRVAIESARDLCRLNPSLASRVGAVTLLVDSILEPSDLVPQTVSVLLKLLDDPVGRAFVRDEHLLRLFSAFTSIGAPTSSEDAMRTRCMIRHVLVAAMRTATGLIALASSPCGLPALIKMLSLPPSVPNSGWSRSLAVDIIHELLSTVSSRDLAIDIARAQGAIPMASNSTAGLTRSHVPGAAAAAMSARGVSDIAEVTAAATAAAAAAAAAATELTLRSGTVLHGHTISSQAHIQANIAPQSYRAALTAAEACYADAAARTNRKLRKELGLEDSDASSRAETGSEVIHQVGDFAVPDQQALIDVAVAAAVAATSTTTDVATTASAAAGLHAAFRKRGLSLNQANEHHRLTRFGSASQRQSEALSSNGSVTLAYVESAPCSTPMNLTHQYAVLLIAVLIRCGLVEELASLALLQDGHREAILLLELLRLASCLLPPSVYESLVALPDLFRDAAASLTAAGLAGSAELPGRVAATTSFWEDSNRNNNFRSNSATAASMEVFAEDALRIGESVNQSTPFMLYSAKQSSNQSISAESEASFEPISTAAMASERYIQRGAIKDRARARMRQEVRGGYHPLRYAIQSLNSSSHSVSQPIPQDPRENSTFSPATVLINKEADDVKKKLQGLNQNELRAYLAARNLGLDSRSKVLNPSKLLTPNSLSSLIKPRIYRPLVAPEDLDAAQILYFSKNLADQLGNAVNKLRGMPTAGMELLSPALDKSQLGAKTVMNNNERENQTAEPPRNAQDDVPTIINANVYAYALGPDGAGVGDIARRTVAHAGAQAAGPTVGGPSENMSFALESVRMRIALALARRGYSCISALAAIFQSGLSFAQQISAAGAVSGPNASLAQLSTHTLLSPGHAQPILDASSITQKGTVAAAAASAISPISLLTPSASLIGLYEIPGVGKNEPVSALLPGALAGAYAGRPAAARAASTATYLSYESITVANSISATARTPIMPGQPSFSPWPSLMAPSSSIGNQQQIAITALPSPMGPQPQTPEASTAGSQVATAPATTGVVLSNFQTAVPVYLVHGWNLGLIIQLTDVDRVSRSAFTPWASPSRPSIRPPSLVSIAKDLAFPTEDVLMTKIRRTNVLNSKDPSQWDFGLILHILETAFTPSHRSSGSNAAAALTSVSGVSGSLSFNGGQQTTGPSNTTASTASGSSFAGQYASSGNSSATFHQLVNIVDTAAQAGANAGSNVISGFLSNSGGASGLSTSPSPSPSPTGIPPTPMFGSAQSSSHTGEGLNVDRNQGSSSSGTACGVAGIRGGTFSVAGAAASAATSATVASFYRTNSGAATLLTPFAALSNLQAALKTKFFKRLLSFLRPDKRMFCDLDWNINHMLHAKVAYTVISVLLSSSEGLGYVFLHQLVDLVLQHLVAETHRAAIFVHASSAAAAAATTASIAATTTAVQAEIAQTSKPAANQAVAVPTSSTTASSFISRLRRLSTVAHFSASSSETASPQLTWWPFTPTGMSAQPSTGTPGQTSAINTPTAIAAAAAAAAIAAGAPVNVPQGTSLESLSIADALATSVNAASAAAMAVGSSNAAYAAAAASAAAAVAEAVAAGSLKRFRPFSRYHQTCKLAGEYVKVIELLARSPVGLTWLERHAVFENIAVLAQSPSHDYLTRSLIRAFDYVAVPQSRLVLEAWVASGSTSVRFAALRKLRLVLKKLSKTRAHVPVAPANILEYAATDDLQASSHPESNGQHFTQPDLLPEVEAWAIDLVLALLFSPDTQVALCALATLEICCSSDAARLLHILRRGVDFEPFGGFAYKLRLEMLSLREGFHFLHGLSYPSSAAASALLQPKNVSTLPLSVLLQLRNSDIPPLASAARMALVNPKMSGFVGAINLSATQPQWNSIIHPGSTVLRSTVMHSLRSGPRVISVPRARMSWIELVISHWSGPGALLHARAADGIVASAVNSLSSPSSSQSPSVMLLRYVQQIQDQQEQQKKQQGVAQKSDKDAQDVPNESNQQQLLALAQIQQPHVSGQQHVSAPPHLITTDSKVLGPAAVALAGIPTLAAVAAAAHPQNQQQSISKSKTESNPAVIPALNRAGLPLPTISGPPLSALTQPHIAPAYSLDPQRPNLWATTHSTETLLDTYMNSRLDDLPWSIDVSIERPDRGGSVERLLTDASIVEGYGDAGVPLECLQILGKCQSQLQNPTPYTPYVNTSQTPSQHQHSQQQSQPLQRLAIQTFLPGHAFPEPSWSCETPGASATYVSARILGPTGVPEPYLLSPGCSLYARLGLGAAPIPPFKAASWASGVTNAWAAPARFEGTDGPSDKNSSLVVTPQGSSQSESTSNLALASVISSLQSAWSHSQNVASSLANGTYPGTPSGVSVLGVFSVLGASSASPSSGAYSSGVSSSSSSSSSGGLTGSIQNQTNNALQVLANWMGGGTPLDVRSSTAQVLMKIAAAAANSAAAAGLSGSLGFTPPGVGSGTIASNASLGIQNTSIGTNTIQGTVPNSLSTTLGLIPGFGNASDSAVARTLNSAALTASPQSSFVAAIQQATNLFPHTRFSSIVEGSPYQTPAFLGTGVDSSLNAEPATFSSTASMLDFLAQQQTLFQQQQQAQAQFQQQQQQLASSNRPLGVQSANEAFIPITWGGGVASNSFESPAIGNMLAAAGPPSPHGPLLIPLEEVAQTQNALFGSYLRSVSVCTPREREAHVVRKHQQQAQIQQQQNQLQGQILGHGSVQPAALSPLANMMGHSSGLRHTVHVNEGLNQLGLDVRLTDITRTANTLCQLNFQQQLHTVHHNAMQCRDTPSNAFNTQTSPHFNVFVHPRPKPPSPAIIAAAVAGATSILSHTYYTTIGNTRWNFVLDPNEPCYADGSPRLYLTSVWFRIPPSIERSPSATLVENPIEALSRTPEGCAVIAATGVLATAEATLLGHSSASMNASALDIPVQQVIEHNDRLKLMIKDGATSPKYFSAWHPHALPSPHALPDIVKGQLWLLGHFGSTSSGFSTLLRVVPRAVSFVLNEAAVNPSLSTRGHCLNTLALWSLSETGKSYLSSRGLLAAQASSSDIFGSNRSVIGAVYPTGNIADALLTAPRIPFAGSRALSSTNPWGIRSVPTANSDSQTDATVNVSNNATPYSSRSRQEKTDAILAEAESSGVITREVLEVILGHMSNLSNAVSQRTSGSTIRKLRDDYRKLFSSQLVFAETLKLLANHRLRQPVRRFILFDLFLRVPFDAKLLALVDEIGI